MSDNQKINVISGEKVRQLRESLGLRRAEFGAKIGYSSEKIQRVEDGLASANDELCKKICEEYKISMEWFLQDEVDTGKLRENEEELRRTRLRQAYMDSGLTHREIAKRSHTSLPMLSEVMSGKKPLTINYAKKIEEPLGVGADWLLYGDEEAKEYPVTETMMKYIKTHPEARKKIKEMMNENGTERAEEEKEDGCS